MEYLTENNMKVVVVVEKQAGEKNCSCFIEKPIDNCMLAGYGETVDKAVEDLLEARREMIEEGRNIPELEMSFTYDIWAFFDKYPLNISAIAKRIGVNPSLMRQYVSGNRKPSGKRIAEIQSAIHAMGRELAGVSLFS